MEIVPDLRPTSAVLFVSFPFDSGLERSNNLSTFFNSYCHELKGTLQIPHNATFGNSSLSTLCATIHSYTRESSNVKTQLPFSQCPLDPSISFFRTNVEMPRTTCLSRSLLLIPERVASKLIWTVGGAASNAVFRTICACVLTSWSEEELILMSSLVASKRLHSTGPSKSTHTYCNNRCHSSWLACLKNGSKVRMSSLTSCVKAHLPRAFMSASEG